ncbi:MAG: TIGR03943 family protein, partial [Cyanobacteria bacterium]|nr:TIGR03943 family protein [Cyanobacteriota bacterium]MDW8200851.1 TIGR03943 family protein [Cyanobacteriota bacterium SKYGB_h_bin112]
MAQPRPHRISRKDRIRRLRQEQASRRSVGNIGFLESLRQRFNPDQNHPPSLLTPLLKSSDRRAQRRHSSLAIEMSGETVSSPRRRGYKPKPNHARSAPNSPSAASATSPILDAVAIVAWAILLFRYWRTGKLLLLIHPNYLGLTIFAGVTLMVVAVLKLLVMMTNPGNEDTRSSAAHVSLFPPILSIVLLVVTAVLGLVIEPRAFASQTAIQRGITDAIPLTRVKPQTFRTHVAPESKSITDWVRTLAAYPEPDAYSGQRAKVQGFVVHPPNFPATHLLISRFVITCCAADVYPVGLPVRLPSDRSAFPPDQWFEVEGV